MRFNQRQRRSGYKEATGNLRTSAQNQTFRPTPYPQGQLTFPGYGSHQAAPNSSFHNGISGSLASNQLNIKQTELKKANEDYLQAKALSLPVIELDSSIGYTSSSSESSLASVGVVERSGQRSSFEASISQTLFDGGIAKHEKQKALAEIEAVQAEIAIEIQEINYETLDLHLDVLREQELIHLFKLRISNLEKQKDNARLLFDYGEGTESDLILVDVKIKDAQIDLADSELSLQQKYTEYFYLTGEDLHQSTNPFVPNIPGSLQAAMELAKTRNPKIALSNSQIKGAESRLKSAKSGLLPKLTLRGAYNTSNGDSDILSDKSSSSVSLNLKMPFSLGGTERSKVRSASLELSKAELERQRTFIELEREITLVWRQIENLQYRIELLKEDVRLSEKSFNQLQQQFDLGNITRSELLLGEKDIIEAVVSLTETKYDLDKSKVKLGSVLGLYAH